MKFISTFFMALAMLVFPAASHAIVAKDKAALVDYILSTKNATNDAKTASLIVEAAFLAGDKYKIDPYYILSVIKAESNFNPKARNRSGASGLMQVIPKYHPEKIKGRSLFNIPVAVDVGAQVINEYLELSDQNLKKAMRRYSGGASDKYYKRIRAMHKELKDAVVAYRFEKELPISVPVYGDARSYHAQIDMGKKELYVPYEKSTVTASVKVKDDHIRTIYPSPILPLSLPKQSTTISRPQMDKSLDALIALSDRS